MERETEGEAETCTTTIDGKAHPELGFTRHEPPVQNWTSRGTPGPEAFVTQGTTRTYQPKEDSEPNVHRCGSSMEVSDCPWSTDDSSSSASPILSPEADEPDSPSCYARRISSAYSTALMLISAPRSISTL
jgi:hypothetical protein